MELSSLLEIMPEYSDLHLVAGQPPAIRLAGTLTRQDQPPLEADTLAAMLLAHLSPDEQAALRDKQDVHTLLSHHDRLYECHVFRERRHLGAAIRIIPNVIPTLKSLNLSPVIETLTEPGHGLVIVAGPTGSGKTTTVAAMVDHINQTRVERILTIEDPISYAFQSAQSMVTQRAVGQDIDSYEAGATYALTGDVNVVFLGELRSPETMRLALVLAETGHLVFSQMHAETVSEVVEQIVNSSPEAERRTTHLMFARVLRGIIAQKLFRRIDRSGRAAANEILLATPLIQTMIRDGQTDMTKAIEENRAAGMQTMDDALVTLFQAGTISEESVQLHIRDQARLRDYLAKHLQ